MLTHWYRPETHQWNKYYDTALDCIIPSTKGSQIGPCRLIQPAQEKTQLHCLQLLSWLNYSHMLMWLYCSWHPYELPQLCPASHTLKITWISQSLAQIPARDTECNSSPTQKGTEQLPARGHSQQERLKPSGKQECARKGVLTRTQNCYGKVCWGCRAWRSGSLNHLAKVLFFPGESLPKVLIPKGKFTCVRSCQHNLSNHMPKGCRNIVIWGILKNNLRKESWGLGGKVIKGQWWKKKSWGLS